MTMNITEARQKFAFKDYLAFTEELVANGRTSGPDQSDKLVEYTKLNLYRMQRVVKTLDIQPEVRDAFQAIRQPQKWTMLVEAWCGDGAQNLPVVAMLAELSPKIEFEILLRDQNLDLMDRHLTNGGRAIPKLIIENENGEVLFSWGPRPLPAQHLVAELKAREQKPTHDELVIEVQKWYVKDKGLALQRELAKMLSEL